MSFLCMIHTFCVIGLFICVFKQKTAYEMRISDWSSDVCSSDLVAADLPGAAGDRLADHRCAQHLVVEDDGERAADVLAGHVAELAGAGAVEPERDDRLAGALVDAGARVGEMVAGDRHPVDAENGRAAWRERGCQEV